MLLQGRQFSPSILQSIRSVRLLSTCASLALIPGVTRFRCRLLSTCVTCFRLALTCVSAFSALTQTAVQRTYAAWPPKVFSLPPLRYQTRVLTVAAGHIAAGPDSTLVPAPLRELLILALPPRFKKSRVRLLFPNHASSQSCLCCGECSFVCCAVSRTFLRVCRLVLAPSSPLQIYSHLTSNLFAAI